MRRTAVLAFTLLVTALAAPPAHAGETVCNQDGVASLCATAEPVMDVTGINYDVGQLDGPGSYQIHYVDLNNGFTSTPQNIGPLFHGQHLFGSMFGELEHCFQVILTSAAGTDLQVGPVCP
ncbi:hypothetical protein [Streptomyces sporangiiformans]|uniref:Secreted protein n=1 Tax=Streptomyces sporangiiformans TaxID=2315329 RepID=A0A505D948_9ACTN|nr:hypothetical protein [Streptomyces sporangiiformans]TPQ18265.1 hypothetical protein FGD71_032030 [Streptomyces sporangiiformans]